MSAPNDLDDGWAELARELGLEGQTPAPTPTSRRDDAPPSHDEAEELVEVPADEPEADEVEADDFTAGAETDGEPEADDADSTDEGEEAEGEGEATPDGEPGEPKKKRRRRRRRKKKGGETAEPVALVPVDGETEEEGEPEAEDESADSDEDAPPTDDSLVEEEGATPAATRELIANWDVPSWETIVNTMLFRPTGNR